MRYSDAELRDLAARAAPLGQRWRGGVVPANGIVDGQTRLQRWRQTLSVEDDRDIFVRRLAFDGLSPETCRPWLGAVRPANGAPLPDWAQRLRALLSRYGPGSAAGEPTASLPFDDVWVPFIATAIDELRRSCGDALHHLSDEALHTFQSQLWATVSSVAALSLSLEFQRFVARCDPLSLLKQAAPDATQTRDLYRRFVAHLRDDGLRTFLHEYPVLARMLAELVDGWVGHITEFCRRLHEDQSALGAMFNHGADFGPVADVRIGVSDPHHHRRDVVIATFATGVRLVYKPKDLGIDVAFWDFIAWLKGQHAGEEALPLRTLTVLNRTGYGWVEFVEHRPCRDKDEAERYYRRIGMLLCLAYVLGATDFHQENILADGEQPVLLDLETLLQPLPQSWDGLRANSADERAIEILHDSVLRTGLLPFWISGNPGRGYDVSGIGAQETADTGYRHVAWEHVNTDRMQLVSRSTLTAAVNRPMLDGQCISAEEFTAAIGSGFAQVYRTLLARRDELLAADGPLRRFRGLKLRCLLRMSKAYGQLLDRRLHPEFLRDGADGGIELERLARDFLVLDLDRDHAPPWDIYRAEVDALERLDFPFFVFTSDGRDLWADGRVVARDYFTESGYARLVRRVRNLSENDLRAQTDLIFAALHARYASRPSDLPDSVDTTVAEQPPLKSAEFVAAAVAIAEHLSQSAIGGADGSVTWLSMVFDPTIDRMNFLPMTDNLYDGRVGIAFFLAALEHVTGGAGFHDLALAALRPLRRALRQRLPSLTAPPSLGAAAGLGGNIYALVRISAWLGDAELLSLAAKAARWFAARRIAADESLDVFGGAAGGILGLLALSAAAPEGDALTAAERCGDHLLARRVRSETGHWVWPTHWTTCPLTGFAHGAAGIALALLRLRQATGKPRFLEAAAEGLAFESAVYCDAARNWPDFRYPANGELCRFMTAWCNGATGIGLGRLACLPVLDTAAIRRDIDNALTTTLRHPLTNDDDVCCGNMGRIELIGTAGRRLNRPELLVEARRRASAVVRRAHKSGRYALYAQVPGVTSSLSLFQGTAGIGYHLLRVAEPGRLPGLLLWE